MYPAGVYPKESLVVIRNSFVGFEPIRKYSLFTIDEDGSPKVTLNGPTVGREAFICMAHKLYELHIKDEKRSI
jgi:hypothetical protein